MADAFIANPDDLELPDDVALAPVRRVKGGSSGVHPEAEVPAPQGSERAPCAVRCAFCGTRVLHGQTAAGAHVVLDLTRQTWLVTYQDGRELPRLARSRGYVEHDCPQKEREPYAGP